MTWVLVLVLAIWAAMILYFLRAPQDEPVDTRRPSDVQRAQRIGISWFEKHARCPRCGRGIASATAVPSSDWGSAELGGCEYRCNKDGATLTVVLDDYAGQG